LKKFVIIVAGGSGKRINTEIPKQFISLAGKPVLIHTISAFYNYSPEINILLVLPKTHFGLWEKLCKNHNFNISHKIVEGGKTRFLSVKNGLSKIEKNGIIAVHDGVRPLVKKQVIEKAFLDAEIYGNAVPAIPVNESVREICKTGSKIFNRSNLRIIQTPQVFKSSILIKAYRQAYQNKFTDDATVVESAGEKINLIEGNPENIKITTSIDLRIAEALLK
jgi:2-C-methyl-D-erythritol 4-phosphate cytidylyltransferase